MKEFKNIVRITGVLVNHTLAEGVTTKGVEYISGDIVLRTSDGSEHKVSLWSNKYKKDSDGNVTNELNKFYTGYVTIMNDYKSIENSPDNPDVVSLGYASFDINDYKHATEDKVVSYNKIYTRFVNRVEPKDLDSTPQIAEFEIEGIIESIEPEIIKGEATGDLIVKFNAVKQRADGYGKNANYEAVNLIPIKFNVPSDIAEGFTNAGYFEGAWTKFTGSILNKVEETTVVEKQAFGKDIVKTFKKTISKNIIESGSECTSPDEKEITQDILTQLINKRKQTLSEILSGNKVGVKNATTTQQPKSNPFKTSNVSNPFKK